MAGIDKVFVPVAGRPLIAWTLAALAAVPDIARHGGRRLGRSHRRPPGADWLPQKVHAVVAGGARRQESVAAGFAALGPDAGDAARVVLVHDGARPLVDPILVQAVIEAVSAHGAAIPILPIAETVKRVDGSVVAGTVDRESLGTAQTPQGVRRGLLELAYDQFPPNGPETWTDEAALLEACRIPVHVIPGSPTNIKVTQPADLRQVEAALAGQASIAAPAATRVGIGQDSHPFGPGEPLALGGVVIDGAPRLLGHSDGDVAIHAVCDALLGAAGLGDLGRVFPAGPATPAGIASTEMLAEVVRRVTTSGWRRRQRRPHRSWPRDHGSAPTSMACVPRLRRPSGCPIDAVNVKASTGNLIGDDGAGRSVSALAVALIEASAMSVRLQDTLTGETRPLVPLGDVVGVYSCGPTVYGPVHIGNFRSFLFADLLVRHLRWRGLAVRWVMNITDVDDKIDPRRCGSRDRHRRADRQASRGFPGRGRGPAHDHTGRAAPGDPAHRPDGRADRDASRARARLSHR